MKILYGVQGHYKDVTEIALKQFKYECLCMNNARYLRIPANAAKRDRAFGDPIYGTLKHVFLNGERKKEKGILYINVDMHEKMSPSANVRKKLKLDSSTDLADLSYDKAKEKVLLIHDSLALNHALFTDNLELQISCAKYIKPSFKVLFIDSDNSLCQIPLIVASLLIKDENFVICGKNNLDKIIENRDLNEFSYKVEDFKEDLPKVILSSPDKNLPEVILSSPDKNLLGPLRFNVIIDTSLNYKDELIKKGYILKDNCVFLLQ